MKKIEILKNFDFEKKILDSINDTNYEDKCINSTKDYIERYIDSIYNLYCEFLKSRNIATDYNDQYNKLLQDTKNQDNKYAKKQDGQNNQDVKNKYDRNNQNVKIGGNQLNYVFCISLISSIIFLILIYLVLVFIEFYGAKINNHRARFQGRADLYHFLN